MFEIVDIVYSRYEGLSYGELRRPLFQGENTNYNHIFDELRESWEIIICTIMSYGWTNWKDTTILNSLVSCLRGTMFIKYVNAYAYVKDA
jgi:hypothetical protein